MREIKYRQPVSERNGGGWHYWGYIGGNLGYFTTPLTSNDGVIRESYQFTGLFDRNGKEIFEGDIIQFYPNAPFIVEWDEDFGKMSYCQKQNMISIGGLFKATAKKVEVIGNIYENPELLS